MVGLTGLDPAGLYFTTVSSDFRLDESDASYVDVIHTDAGVLGTNRRNGDVDFYPNGGSRQPGCLFKCKLRRSKSSHPLLFFFLSFFLCYLSLYLFSLSLYFYVSYICLVANP